MDKLQLYTLYNDQGPISQNDQEDPLGEEYHNTIQESLDCPQPEGWVRSDVYGLCYALKA